MSRPSHRILPLLALGLVVALAAYGHLSAGVANAPAPAPFDPLSKAEQKAAVQAAFDSPVVRLRLSDSYEVIGASLHTDKEHMLQARPPRLADVQIYDYRDDEVVWVVVDIRAAQVIESIPLLFPYQPPLTEREMVRAVEIARSHPETAARLPDVPVLPTAHLWSDALAAPCNTHRCVSVSFYTEDLSWGFESYTLVDLSRGRVIDVRVPDLGEAV